MYLYSCTMSLGYVFDSWQISLEYIFEQLTYVIVIFIWANDICPYAMYLGSWDMWFWFWFGQVRYAIMIYAIDICHYDLYLCS